MHDRMRQMIIVLDSTVLLSNPHLKSTWWEGLIAAASSWNARVVVPNVVIAETVANFRRNVTGLLPKLDEWGKKENRFGVAPIREAAAKSVLALADGFEDSLSAALMASGVSIVEPPSNQGVADHSTVARRVAEHRKPADGAARKDGYRDTLNWLTVLDLADAHPGVDILWISHNTDDFGAATQADKDRPTWHEEILAELNHRGLADRVKWYLNIPTLLQQVAVETQPVVDDENSSPIDRMSRQDLAHRGAVAAIGRSVKPRAVALPKIARRASIIEIQELQNVEVSEGGTLQSGEVVVSFVGSSRVVLEFAIASMSGDELLATEKTLEISGVATLAEDGTLTAVSITDIVAPKDDPGHEAWKEGATSIARARWLDAQAAAKIQALVPTMDDEQLLRTMRSFVEMSPETLSNVEKSIASLTPEQLSSIQGRVPNFEPSMLANLADTFRAPDSKLLSPETLAKVTELANVDQGFLDDIADAVGGSNFTVSFEDESDDDEGEDIGEDGSSPTDSD